MPQIREQIAMVHLPPSKTLKYLFHVRKTRRRGIYIRGGFIFAGRRLARAEAAQVRGLDHSERYVGRALLLAGRNPLVLTVNSGAAALQRPLARFGYRLSLNRYMTLLLCGFTDAAAAV